MCYNVEMSEENKKTLEIYEKYGKNYLDNAKHRNSLKQKEVDEEYKKAILDGFGCLGKRARILEIGAGSGEASLMAKKLKFKAYASDVPEYFLDVIRATGLPCYKFNVLTDDLEGRKFDGVMAFRVFPHFNPKDLEVALSRVYKLLRPGGRFVGSMINIEDKKVRDGWYDFPGKYHIGAERYYYYYSQDELKKAFSEAGLVLDKMDIRGGDSGKRWFEFVLTKPSGVRPEIVKYIEKNILPEYKKVPGHANVHIDQVISRSLTFAEDLHGVDLNMVYVIAAYHDLGRLIDDEAHNIISAEMMRNDERLRDFFSEDDIETMAEAVEDHRASLEGDPRSIYGKIVSSADRNVDVDDMIARSYSCALGLYPEKTEDERIEIARTWLYDKYRPEGYAARKIYFYTPDDKACFEKIKKITKDPIGYRKIVKRFIEEHGKEDCRYY